MQLHSDHALFEKVASAVGQTVYIEGKDVTPTCRLADDLRIGRFGRIRLALYLEESFDVELPDEAVHGFSTVGDIVRYISRWSLGSDDFSGYAMASTARQ